MFTIFVTVKQCEYYTLIKNINLLKPYQMNFIKNNIAGIFTILLIISFFTFLACIIAGDCKDIESNPKGQRVEGYYKKMNVNNKVQTVYIKVN